MFDIAWTELLVVAVIAIIVVGPKELPAMLRAFGKAFSQVRRTAREFQSTFNDALREAERQAALDDVKKEFDEVRKLDPSKDLRKGLDETKRAIDGRVGDARTPKPDVVPINGAEAKRAGAGREDGADAPETPRGTVAEQPSVPAAKPGAADEAPRAAAGADRR